MRPNLRQNPNRRHGSLECVPIQLMILHWAKVL